MDPERERVLGVFGNNGRDVFTTGKRIAFAGEFTPKEGGGGKGRAAEPGPMVLILRRDLLDQDDLGTTPTLIVAANAPRAVDRMDRLESRDGERVEYRLPTIHHANGDGSVVPWTRHPADHVPSAKDPRTHYDLSNLDVTIVTSVNDMAPPETRCRRYARYALTPVALVLSPLFILAQPLVYYEVNHRGKPIETE